MRKCSGLWEAHWWPVSCLAVRAVMLEVVPAAGTSWYLMLPKETWKLLYSHHSDVDLLMWETVWGQVRSSN